MRSSLSCPHCHATIELARLRHQGMLARHRLCPSCSGAFTVDAATRRRQAWFIGVALISLALTMLLYFRGAAWLAPAAMSWLVLGGLIWWANPKVYLVAADASTTDRA